MTQKPFIPVKLKPWIEARRRHGLSHAQVQMARELGMNPRKLGKLDNHRQEPWKAPLKEFIVLLYEKRFGKPAPDTVRSIEEIAASMQTKREAKRDAKRAPTVPCDVPTSESEH